jgi:hypothetical protein
MSNTTRYDLLPRPLPCLLNHMSLIHPERPTPQSRVELSKRTMNVS